MKRILGIITLILILLVPVVQADGSWTVDLVAGQNTTIGDVTFTIAGGVLTADYNILSPGWCMTTTQFYAGNEVPSNAPGQYPYKHEGLDCATSDSFAVPVPEGDVYVAAHADSNFDPERASEVDNEPIGDSGTMTLSSASSTYFTATVDVDGLETQYPAFCVDLGHYISTGQEYDISVSLADGAMVDKPDNLDLIQYIINQDYGVSGYTIQLAIWYLIDDIDPYMTSDAMAIVEDALANGEGFTPGCGDLMGVFLEPGPDIQTIMAVVPAPCEVDLEGEARGETAWALADWGVEFGQGWGMYFQLYDDGIGDEPGDDGSNPGSGDDPVVNAPGNSGNTPAVDRPANDNEAENRSRREEAIGQGGETPPGDRSDEAPGNN